MGRVVSFLLTLGVLELAWDVLVGTTQSSELIVGARGGGGGCGLLGGPPLARVGGLFALTIR